MRNAFLKEVLLRYASSANKTLAVGNNTLVDGNGCYDLEVSDAHEISGIIDCDQSCTVYFYHGFRSNNSINSAGQINFAPDGNLIYSASDSVTVVANGSYPSGSVVTPPAIPVIGGTKIAAINCLGQYLRVVVVNNGSATANFRIFLTKVRR